MVKSMFAAVAGLRAHQARMDVIGNNIANVNTYAYKKMRATFRDQFYATMRGASEAGNVYGGRNPSQLGYGSQVNMVDVNFGTGGIASTGNGMDAMIVGNGFFLVGQYNGAGLSTTSLQGAGSLTQLSLTRVGIFNIDGQGNLVDANGNYVYGFEWTVRPDGKMVANKDANLQMLHVPLMYMNANGTPVTYMDTSKSPAVERFQTIDFMRDLQGNYVLDEFGQRMLIYPGFEPITDPDHDDYDEDYNPRMFNAYYNHPESVDENGVNIYDPMRPTVLVPMVPFTTPAEDPADRELIETYEDMIEYLDGLTNAELAAYAVDANPFYVSPMKLYSISIGPDGTVSGMNEKNEIVSLGYVAVANVPNPNALEAQGNGYYKAKDNTGIITAEVAGEGSTGPLNSGTLEMANVDLAEEFTDMITTQRGFQANTRIITVTDEMLAELVNMKR